MMMRKLENCEIAKAGGLPIQRGGEDCRMASMAREVAKRTQSSCEGVHVVGYSLPNSNQVMVGRLSMPFFSI